MTDLFKDKAEDWDDRPLPVQISQGVFAAVEENVALRDDLTVLDFGAGTGLLAGRLAPRVQRVLAVDISEAMLDRLAAKPELAGRVETICQDIVDKPLDRQVDLVVSAMAMHHVDDTRALLSSLYDHLVPGGQVALADLDTEEGDFHPADVTGVFHAGFDRAQLGAMLEEVGFSAPHFVTACAVDKGDKRYPIFLVTASRPRR